MYMYINKRKLREITSLQEQREKVVLWEDMSLLAMNSLYKEKGNEGYLWCKA